MVRAVSVIKARCRFKESKDVHMLLNWKPGLLQYISERNNLLGLSLSRI